MTALGQEYALAPSRLDGSIAPKAVIPGVTRTVRIDPFPAVAAIRKALARLRPASVQADPVDLLFCLALGKKHGLSFERWDFLGSLAR